MVIGRTEDSGDERAVLYVQIRGESDLARRNVVRDELRSVIPRTLMPREIVFVTRWPATTNGKIDRRALERGLEGNDQ
ncbi:Linear gramicidin synthase subunit D [compost metagenome]